MTDHRASTARRFASEAHLDSGFRQVDLQGHLLSHEDVRVPRLVEQTLQQVELGPSEGRPLSPLFARGS